MSWWFVGWLGNVKKEGWKELKRRAVGMYRMITLCVNRLTMHLAILVKLPLPLIEGTHSVCSGHGFHIFILFIYYFFNILEFVDLVIALLTGWIYFTIICYYFITYFHFIRWYTLKKMLFYLFLQILSSIWVLFLHVNFDVFIWSLIEFIRYSVIEYLPYRCIWI